MSVPGRVAGIRGRPVRLDRITGSQREYIQWLLACCTQGRIKVESILTEDATDLLATKLRTPLQVQRYLTLTLESAYQVGEKPISAEVVGQCYRDKSTIWSRH